MESLETTLELEGEPPVPSPTLDDIARALAKQPRGDDWSLELTRGGGDFLVAFADGTGGLELEAEESGQSFSSDDTPDDTQLQALFASFLAGDNAWKEAIAWSRQEPVPPPSETNRIPAPIWVVMSLIGIGLVSGWMGLKLVLYVVGAIFIPAFIAAAAYEKWREVRRAASWKKATARIVRSERITETRRDSDGGNARTVTLPAIEYEFSVALKTWRGSRVSIGEILPDTPAVDEALKKYPVGTSATAYYDPADPRFSVLERDPPAPFPVIFGVLGALALVLALAALWMGGAFR